MDNESLNAVIFDLLLDGMRNDRQALTKIGESLALRVLTEMVTVFMNEPNVLRLSGDFVVVGDIHGNIDDLLRIFDRFGYPPYQQYCFLGDYVDRGKNSLEVLLLLYSLKLKFPSDIYLIRGNHESHQTAKAYGFRKQCISKYSKKVYRRSVSTFSYMPLCAVLNDTVFCVHGGLSPEITTLSKIESFQRPITNVLESPIAGLLWSDPSTIAEEYISSSRGVGYFYGSTPLGAFLDDNQLSIMIRAHEFCVEGYKWPFGTNGDCLTIFSTSNYCERKNKASVALVSPEGDVRVRTLCTMTEDLRTKRRIALPEWLLNETETTISRPLDAQCGDDFVAVEIRPQVDALC